jgi:hypothetical protein
MVNDRLVHVAQGGDPDSRQLPQMIDELAPTSADATDHADATKPDDADLDDVVGG